MIDGDACDEIRLLIQADIDGELGPADAARVGVHVAQCPACAKAQSELLALSRRLRRSAPYYAAPEALRVAVAARIAAAAVPPAVLPLTDDGVRADRRTRASSRWRGLPRLRLHHAASFGGGFVLAACLALALVPPHSGGQLPDAVVASHIRALQPGHLADVASTDQHTVKPWFDGRLDYAPPVKDLKAEGFPLAGGRLDYLAGRPVAALVYQHRQHIIELFAWPDGSHFGRSTADGSRSGYNFLNWQQDGMAFWAVSDLNAPELADFVRLWRAG